MTINSYLTGIANPQSCATKPSWIFNVPLPR